MVATAYQQTGRKASKANGARDTGIKMPAKPARYRTMHKFWLDLTCTADEQLHDCIDNLKRYRMFTPTIRDGIRLIVALREKRLDVLFELFPWFCDWLEMETERRINARLMDRVGEQDALKAQLAKLEALIEQGAAAPTTPGPKPMSIPSIPGPVDDDDDTLVVTKAKSDGKSAQNFLDAAFGIIQ
jgi:hypothetical protein